MPPVYEFISKQDYTVLNTTCIHDPRLSLDAKGLYAFLCYATQDGRMVNKTELVKNHPDGIDSINSALNELLEFGYMEVSEEKKDGTVMTVLDYPAGN